ncbi:hypothetical protein MUK42_02081 [Musa troglodytarum]|uniref:Uncharacterized protein n=1 Tax=Musa troglodytarum TaxID=320322 RepID=A0A9E7FS90_9LILI|nr:hypothetical protein MUK42_02081 [Musa troglodytarum]
MGASESLLPVHRHQPIDEITTVSQRIEGVDPLLERVEALKIVRPCPLLPLPAPISFLRSTFFSMLIVAGHAAADLPPPSESSLSDILVRKPSSSSSTSTSGDHFGSFSRLLLAFGSVGIGTLNPNVLLELFSMYREWQEEKAKKISRKQEEIESKIETADAVKLFQRFNYSVSAMRSTTQSLAEEEEERSTAFPAFFSFVDGLVNIAVQQLQVEVGELKGRLTEVISNCDMLCKRIVAEGPESLRSSLNPISTSNAEMPSICYLNNKVPDE